MIRKTALLATAVALIVSSGCAARAANQRVEEYRAALDPVVGSATTTMFLDRWGPPQARETIEGRLIWTYNRAYGSRVWAAPIGRTVVAQSVESFDRVVLQFQGGVLVNWQAYVQR